MADRVSGEQRSYIMSRIKAKETKPETIVRKFLFQHGFRYRKNVKKLPGTPDIVLKKYRTIIFVNGCFWHGHAGCKHFKIPKSNIEFWETKIKRNVERDAAKTKALEELGWTVVTVWECQLKKEIRDQTLHTLKNLMLKQSFIDQENSGHYRKNID